MHVVGWLQKPSYDKANHVVYLALELQDDKDHWANAISLQLARGGYEELVWAGPIGIFQSAAGKPALLSQALGSHVYDAGSSYRDFQDGDRVAAFGMAGLVAAALGLKFGKGLIAGLVALLLAGKKVILPVIVIAGGAFARFRRRLLGGSADS